MPLWGGVAVYLAILLGIAYARFGSYGTGERLDALATAVCAAAGLVCLAGCIDDASHLRAHVKLAFQFCSLLPIVAAGYYTKRVTAFGYDLEFGYLGIPLTLLWLLGCINAMNLLDGMDGLASTVGLFTAVMMGVIAHFMGNGYVTVVAVVMAGSLAGFLVHNLPPARIFLGDSGSMVIGLVVGLLGVQSTLKTTATLSITAPLVVMTFPMFDTVLAVVRRELSGRRFDAADRQHIHHRLLDRGMSPWVVLLVIGTLCLATGAAAFVATMIRSDALAWVTAITLILLAVRLRLFGNHELALIAASARRLLAKPVVASAAGDCLAVAGVISSRAPIHPTAAWGAASAVAARSGAAERHSFEPARGLPAGLDQPDVDIGITYTHERQWMPRLLSTLASSCRGVHARLILVDNHSAGIEPWLEYFPDTVVLRNARRMGYAANMNRILEASTGRHVLLLNTDMFFDPAQECVARMVRFMDGQAECGIAGCRVYHADGQYAYPARRFQTVKVALARRLGLGPLMPKTLDDYLYRDRDCGETWPCQWLSGCFLMVHREAFEEVGYFDECFVKYFEDVDMCLRMARSGWQVMHYGGDRVLSSRRPWQPKPGVAGRVASPPFVPAVAPQMGPIGRGSCRAAAEAPPRGVSSPCRVVQLEA